MTNDDSRLEHLFQRYRVACPDIEPSANFMPNLWQKIEARHNFWFIFQRLARGAMTASAALCLLLLLLNIVWAPQALLPASSYVDALVAEQTAEKTDYTEDIRMAPVPDEALQALHQ
jgi:hypothetical protein